MCLTGEISNTVKRISSAEDVPPPQWFKRQKIANCLIFGSFLESHSRSDLHVGYDPEQFYIGFLSHNAAICKNQMSSAGMEKAKIFALLEFLSRKNCTTKKRQNTVDFRKAPRMTKTSKTKVNA